MADALIQSLRAALGAEANPEKAAYMQAYMKSTMPYCGVNAPALKRIAKQIIEQHPFDSQRDWMAAVRSLFQNAQFREERYAALELLGARRYRAHRTMDCLELYEELIVTGAWWDLVDPVASTHVGALFTQDRAMTTRAMRVWSREENLWKRRTAIICQIKAKDATDLDLLYDAIEPNLEDKDFFIRKAIGWALRSYAWTDAAEVSRYVERRSDRLSGLSKREALKNVAKGETNARRKTNPNDKPNRGSAPEELPHDDRNQHRDDDQKTSAKPPLT